MARFQERASAVLVITREHGMPLGAMAPTAAIVSTIGSLRTMSESSVVPRCMLRIRTNRRREARNANRLLTARAGKFVIRCEQRSIASVYHIAARGAVDKPLPVSETTGTLSMSTVDVRDICARSRRSSPSLWFKLSGFILKCAHHCV